MKKKRDQLGTILHKNDWVLILHWVLPKEEVSMISIGQITNLDPELDPDCYLDEVDAIEIKVSQPLHNIIEKSSYVQKLSKEYVMLKMMESQ